MTANRVRRVDAVKSDSASLASQTSVSAKKNAFRPFLLVGSTAFLVASLFSAPEGAIREGDFLLIANLFLLFLASATFCLYRFRRDSNGIASEPTKPRSKRTIWIDRFLGIFILLATLSYLRVVLFRVGDVRLATNAFWTFVIPPLFYFFLRAYRTYFSKSALLGLLLVVLSGAVAQSVYSTYSYAVLNPQLREAYRADPEKMLRENGLNFGQDSRERLLFEKRLLDSSEPTGTYGLANTLAGLLAPAFVLTLLIVPWKKLYLSLTRDAKSRRSTAASSLLWTLALLLIFFVLILTKSRSGALAAVSGVGIYCLLSIWRFAKKDGKTTVRVVLGAVAVLFAFIVALSGAFAVGLVDREVFTEAGKSLGYRLDYWRASASMIRDYPLFGIGPGEFQALYARYILPTASEFIADPHNFAFEIAALFGVPALIFYALFVLSLICAALVGKKAEATTIESPENVFVVPKSLWLGAFLGLLILILCVAFQSAPVDFKFLFFAAATFGILLFSARILFANVDVDATCTNGSLIATLATFLINLCAAGGVGYPAIAAPFFLIAAFLTNRLDACERTSEQEKRLANETPKPRKDLSKIATLASATLLILFNLTAFQPYCRAALFKLRYTLENASTSPYVDALNSGKTERVDRFSTSVALQFYYFAIQKYCENPSPQNKELWQKTRERLQKNSPNSATWRENCADLNWSLYQRAKLRTEFRDDALNFYRECVERSPTECAKRAKLALVEFELGDVEQAKIDAKEALEQDERTPHEDRKLEDDLRQKLRDALK